MVETQSSNPPSTGTCTNQIRHQLNTVRLETWQKSFKPWSKVPALICTFPLLATFYIYTRTHTHLLLLTSAGRGSLWSFVATATLKNHIHSHIHHHTGQVALETPNTGKEKAWRGGCRWTHLPENVSFPCFWSFLQHRPVQSVLLTVLRSYWAARLTKLTLFHVEVYTQHLLHEIQHPAMPNCSV